MPSFGAWVAKTKISMTWTASPSQLYANSITATHSPCSALTLFSASYLEPSPARSVSALSAETNTPMPTVELPMQHSIAKSRSLMPSH
ncbi:hypothetical protein [Rubritalea tangerina]|uniref:hypothetical protein n=1 Tax=Rubritalea tangerina TaxID=430798 RepID=UPI003623D153